MEKAGSGILAAIIGMVLGIIALFGGMVVFFISTGWASFEGGLLGAVILGSLWTVFSLVSLILCLVGRKKMVAAGKSPLLGIIGIVIGVLAVMLSIGIIVASYASNNAI
jgi:hypothetical protein